MPLRDPDTLRRAVHFVLARPGLFLNTSSDATILEATLRAAAETVDAPATDALERDAETLGIEPLFVRGVSDAI